MGPDDALHRAAHEPRKPDHFGLLARVRSGPDRLADEPPEPEPAGAKAGDHDERSLLVHGQERGDRRRPCRAAEELDAWQREYPAEKTGGYLTLLLARYWAERGKYAQAVAQAEQLQAVNPDSAYTDQILFLAAECDVLRDRPDRAAATLHSIIKDYPGSPLVPAAQKKLAELEKK